MNELWNNEPSKDTSTEIKTEAWPRTQRDLPLVRNPNVCEKKRKQKRDKSVDLIHKMRRNKQISMLDIIL